MVANWLARDHKCLVRRIMTFPYPDGDGDAYVFRCEVCLKAHTVKKREFWVSPGDFDLMRLRLKLTGEFRLGPAKDRQFVDYSAPRFSASSW